MSNHDESLKSMKAMELSLVGDGETTLVTQIQKLRTSIIDKSDEHRKSTQDGFTSLVDEFREFARQQTENNSKALVEALNEVIRDFNTKINEQFGDNFKQLNEAVGKLLEWQEQYRQQMTELVSKLDSSASSLSNIDQSLITVSQTLQSVIELMDELNSFLEATRHNVKILENSISTHADMAERAKSAFPVIESSIRQLVQSTVEQTDAAINHATRSASVLSEAIERQSKQLGDAGEQLVQNNARVLTALEASLRELVVKSSARIEKNIDELDRALQQELNNALATLGSQLASLSARFCPRLRTFVG